MKIAPLPCELRLQLDQPTRFSPSNALALCTASQWAYDWQPNIVGSRWDTQALYLDCEESRVLAFRGTAGWRDLITDISLRGLLSLFIPALGKFKTTPVGIPGARVHQGFWAALDEVFTDILDSVADDPRPLFITGHSLGGALAYNCAGRLQRHGIPPHAIYTYGQPSTGNLNYSRYYLDTGLANIIWRIINEEDIVARIPFSLQSAGQRVMFSSDGNLLINPSILLRLASDITGFYRAWGKGEEDLVSDHFLKKYHAKLEGL